MADQPTTKPKISIACQGGGSQTAFTAGVLKTLFDNDIHHQRNIVGLSGTSGGALNAALAWYGLLKAAKGDKTPISKRIGDFWDELTAKEPAEILLDEMTMGALRGISEGMLPNYEISPSSSVTQWMQTALSAFLPRKRYTDFRGLLESHINFDEIPSLIEPTSPVLLVGAANVKRGNLKIFSSRAGEIGVEAVLASACIPTLFPAVQIGEDFFWDGLFAANPPVNPLVQYRYVGKENIPQEIWIIFINAITCDHIPTKPHEIVDRRNAMVGNVSLLQDLNMLGAFERAFRGGGLVLDVFKELGYPTDTWIKLRLIHMSKQTLDTLDYASKLSRAPEHIHRLMEDGARQARQLIENLSAPAYTCEEMGRILTGQTPGPAGPGGITMPARS
jgi:NTE family protein